MYDNSFSCAFFHRYRSQSMPESSDVSSGLLVGHIHLDKVFFFYAFFPQCNAASMSDIVKFDTDVFHFMIC